ncbi:MAG: acyl-CoA thioesterase [Gammaproteobacteria bacterium]
MPADANVNGDIFGGWLVSQMDLAAAITARQRARGRIATVAIHALTFRKPVHIGDLICCYGTLQKVGHSSMTIDIEAWAVKSDTMEKYLVTEGCFVCVAIDTQGKPRPVDLTPA